MARRRAASELAFALATTAALVTQRAPPTKAHQPPRPAIPEHALDSQEAAAFNSFLEPASADVPLPRCRVDMLPTKITEPDGVSMGEFISRVLDRDEDFTARRRRALHFLIRRRRRRRALQTREIRSHLRASRRRGGLARTRTVFDRPQPMVFNLETHSKRD